ncbi:MAG TPA: hypothetical protein VL995_14525 [Cellvibrio sp.]|nr:hypothetical protein [Cellvibrio sp.]
MKLFFKITLLLTLIFSPWCKADERDDSFQLFWTEFRAAVMQNDYEQLKRFTKFPLAVNGVADFIPVEYIERKAFKDIFHKLMDQKIHLIHGDDYTLTDMMDVVSKTEAPLDAKNGDEYRVEQLVFEYIDGRWLFTRAYLDEQ